MANSIGRVVKKNQGLTSKTRGELNPPKSVCLEAKQPYGMCSNQLSQNIKASSKNLKIPPTVEKLISNQSID